MNEPLTFSSKAETLEQLAPSLSSAAILPLVHFSLADWEGGRAATLNGTLGLPWTMNKPLAVRSSAFGEDTKGASQAGRFLTLLDVPPHQLEEAIERVFASYQEKNLRNRVLIQPMLTSVQASGVAFTLDPNTGSPYTVVNYERRGNTQAVTGGRSGNLSTFYSWNEAPPPDDPMLAMVLALGRELEELTGHQGLDFEFAFSEAGEVILLQVRPLVLRAQAASAGEIRPMLERIAARICSANKPHPYLRGQRTVFGIMPDWNPAEIIGVRPRPLALSLYRELVTDSIWAYQRSNYGYRNLRSFPLMVDFHGLPYIDVRVSFNSFIPADVPDDLANLLVSHYIDQLASSPALHDKVEFEIVLSCYTFDIAKRLERLPPSVFSSQDRNILAECLRKLTNRIVNQIDGLWRADLEKIDELNSRRTTIGTSDLDPVCRVYWLMEDCKRFGTLPFAGLARAGFIAMQLLNSLIEAGILTTEERAAFLSGLDTISARMTADQALLDRTLFLKRYGHLRPGTYDILSPRYDEAPDYYFDWTAADIPPSDKPDKRKFALSLDQIRTIERLIKEHDLELDVVGLFEFLETAIRGREYAKFVFTNSLSDILVLLKEIGQNHGFSAEDMSYFDIAFLKDMYTGCPDLPKTLEEAISRGRKRHAETLRIVLPPILSSHDEVWQFHLPPTEPNYITQQRASGPKCTTSAKSQLEGAIVMIPSADPGFDWIFVHRIAGFITAYGGVNSHMAIRASELCIPAVIGAGEINYQAWSRAEILEIDAGNRQVTVVR